jgi:hypothetical protein
MTAMKDAFRKAGVDTEKLSLRSAANEALDAALGNVARAVPRFAAMLKRGELREAIAREYLERVAAERGHAPVETPTTGSIEVREHRVKKHRRRTHDEREAALQSAGHAAASMATAYDRQIDGRPIGDLAWGELQALRHENAINAASYLRFGTEATANFILLDKIEAHCRVTDHGMKVKDAISEEQLRMLIEQADDEAPRWIGAGMQAWIGWLEQQRSQKLISP